MKAPSSTSTMKTVDDVGVVVYDDDEDDDYDDDGG